MQYHIYIYKYVKYYSYDIVVYELTNVLHVNTDLYSS